MKRAHDDLTKVKRELAHLKKDVAKLRKQLASQARAKKTQFSQMVVESLQVINKAGTLVAEIDKAGNLFCRSLSASTEKSVRGVFLNGPEREVQAGRIHLSSQQSSFRTVEIKGDQSYGLITLRDAKSKQATSLSGHGAALVARSRESAAHIVTVDGSYDQGGSVHIGSANGPEAATLRVNRLNKAGQVTLVDANGKTWVGPLPGKPMTRTKSR
jgi:hypothetical protein